jgi:glycosyltransferase involved in cell wall biosynthesis
MKLLTLSVVIPTYNSSNYIDITIKNIVDYLKSKNILFEIILVDDNSNDNTIDKILKLKESINELVLIQLFKNHGQRLATSVGYKNAKGDYVVTFDDDLQFYEEDIYNLLIAIKSSENLVVTAYYDYEEKQQSYNSIKKSIFFSVNHIFFPFYRNAKYFTPFKIFDKKKMNISGITNIYYFWKFKNNLIGTYRVEKRKGLRAKKNYGPKQYYRLFSPLVYKVLLKVFLFAGIVILILLIIFKTYELLIICIFNFLVHLFFSFLLNKNENVDDKISFKLS